MPFFLRRAVRLSALVLAGCCVLPVAAQGSDFSAEANLALEGEGPWYRLEVPLALQLEAAHGDLRDLRVIDAQGKVQAYSFGQARERYSETLNETPVARFPLHARRNSQERPQVSIRRKDDGTLVELTTASGRQQEGQELRGWLLDASTAKGALRSLVLDWQEEPGEGFQQFSIEASDDLQHWRAWGTGQVARLAFADDRILQAGVELPGLQAKYLRLLWLEPREAPMLRSATLVSVQGDSQPVPIAWSEPLVAGASAEGELFWELPLALPVQRIRLDPLERGTLAPVRLNGRLDATQPWQTVASGVLYHLPERGVERLQDELSLPGRAVRQLSLQVDSRGGGLGATPRLRIGLPATEVVFLARGVEPYRLVVGDARLQDRSLPLATLDPSASRTDGRTYPMARIDGPLMLAAQHESESGDALVAGLEAKRIGLWVVLLSGVGLLLLMSLRMLRKPAEEV